MKLKNILWFLLLAILWLPLLQATFKFITSAPLKGAFTNHPKPTFSDSLWFDGAFQKNYELYINDSIGFNNDFIRLRNQIDYSIFNKCHSFDIEVGKNGYLVATTHVDAALGKTFVSETKIDSTVYMLSKINDTLQKLNKTLVIMLAPNRGKLLIEQTPGWYKLEQKRESDHVRYAKKLSQTAIKFIDYDQWFSKLKTASSRPLFTKCGIHWSNYGAALAGDTLIKLIEKQRGIDMPDMKITQVVLSDSAREPDADLNNALNLIWDVKNDTMAYPVIVFDTTKKTRPSALIIGDSFFFNVSNQGITVQAFKESSFWYYNNSIFSTGSNNGKKVADVSLSEEINKHDVFIVIATDVNLHSIGWGFIKNTYDNFYNSKNIEYYKKKIREDAAWYTTVLQKAKDKNISVEEQLNSDAVYAMSIDKN